MTRCLFVDHSSVIRKVAKRILADLDMMVVEASTGLEALEICGAEMPDLVVIDGALSDMPAVDLIRRVRAMEARKPQILISLVVLDVASVMRAKRAGADGYLLKPFNRLQLVERILGLKIVA
jgi:two-component system chemotaxis response regulator CheY